MPAGGGVCGGGGGVGVGGSTRLSMNKVHP